MDFVSFHTHTTFSYADGIGSPLVHGKRQVELGMRAGGLAEHGNVNSHPSWEQVGEQLGLRTHYGLEAYFAPPGTRQKFHLTLVAMNEEGYHNLNRIVTQSYYDFYQFPTVTWNTLETYNAGIAVLSGCADGLLSCTLLGGKSLGDKRDVFSEEDLRDADRRIRRFHDVFGSRFFLEVQRIPRLDRTRTLNPAFATLGAKHGIPLIATADVHYPYPQQNRLQATLHAARWNSAPDQILEASWEYDANLTYPTSDLEILNDLIGTGLTKSQATEAIFSTTALSDACSVKLPKAAPLRFNTSGGMTARQALIVAIRKGLAERQHQRPEITPRLKEYQKRIETEFKVIADKDFCDYFLVTADLVEWAKNDDIDVGPGRGSAAGSLVCYVLGITEIDPLHPTFSRMVFERFIDPTRSDMPDIDLDFDDEQRHKVGKRAREVYGPENVCSVANHTRYRGKLALANVAAAHNLPRNFFDEIGKRCTVRVETDDRVDDSILDVIEAYGSHPKIRPLISGYGNLLQEAIELEGQQHSMGIHAGGYIVASDEITNVCAIYTKEKGSGSKREMTQVIPYEKRDAEYLGMLKMDFLGLTTMGMIHYARQWTDMPLKDLYKQYYLDYQTGGSDNEQILQAFRDDDCMGIFQYEGGTTRQVVRQVQPDNFDELAACGALSRPGPYYGGQTADYVKVKNGEKDWERIHPNFDKHVEWTYGQIVYQEQIMWILRDLAGFDVPRVLKVRKIIGKKLGEFQFAALWDEFKTGCAENGVDEASALRVWQGITTAAGYAFNTAHAYSYALVAWWQMWFKIHHPREFFASSLRKNGDGKDDLPRRTALINDSQLHLIDVIPPMPLMSDTTWIPGAGQQVLAGFMQMPDVGEATAKAMVDWRDNTYLPSLSLDGRDLADTAFDWFDFLRVSKIGESTAMKMYEFATAADPFGVKRTGDQLRKFRKQNDAGEFEKYGLPSPLSYAATTELPESDCRLAFVGMVGGISEKDEIETIRQKKGGTIKDALDVWIAKGNDPEKTKKATLFAYDEFGDMALRISAYRYDSMQAQISQIEENHHIVVGWGRFFAERGKSLQLEQLWVLEPD